MKKRVQRRLYRIHNKESIGFLPPADNIPGSDIKVSDALKTLLSVGATPL